MGSRITPDNNDILVWLLNETSGAYRNTGSLSPNSSTTDLNITNAITIRDSNGIFDNCPTIPGLSSYPSGASATRNYAAGAKTINPAPPLTVSCWVFLKTYIVSANQNIIGKEYRDSSLISSWTTPFYALSIDMLSGNNGQDWKVSVATNATTRVSFTVLDFPIPIGQWSHVGFTHDGSNIRVYLNGCQCIYYTSGTQLNTVACATPSYSDGTHGNGFWKIGAITATGSTDKEEASMLIQDVRVANVARSADYFYNVYQAGNLAGYIASATRYYKLRAYDTSCSTPTAVTWIDTEISLTNAPTAPCGSLSDPEVMDTWLE